MNQQIPVGRQRNPSVVSDQDAQGTTADHYGTRIAVVIPCYRVVRHIGATLRRIGREVSLIYCVDDGCPDGSGAIAERVARDDPRIQVAHHDHNMGVGAAVLTGYRRAIADGADVIVKLDGDGQMAPELIPELVAPILRGEADYVKGNRFFNLDNLRAMPWIRVFGNAGLSFLSKLSSGYWNLFDPTNGFTAIHASVAAILPFDKLNQRYFFESDILFRLNILRAVTKEIPHEARYADERSNLRIGPALLTFPFLHLRNYMKRLFYSYFLRDFNLASISLMVGVLLMGFGITFGVAKWIRGSQLDVLSPPATVMLAALPIVLGWQALLSFLNFDVANVPHCPLHPTIGGIKRLRKTQQ